MKQNTSSDQQQSRTTYTPSWYIKPTATPYYIRKYKSIILKYDTVAFTRAKLYKAVAEAEVRHAIGKGSQRPNYTFKVKNIRLHKAEKYYFKFKKELRCHKVHIGRIHFFTECDVSNYFHMEKRTIL